MLTMLAHAGHDSGAHHYVFVLAAVVVGFLAGRLSMKSALVAPEVTTDGR